MEGDGTLLPDTDDPHELLGVEPGVELGELKRAYARLIKVHRPDRSPGEFQRIHAAFEHLVRSLRHRETAAARVAPVEPSAAEPFAEPRASFDPVRGSADAVPARPPSEAERVHGRFLALLAERASTESLCAVWVNGLEAHLDLAAAIFDSSPLAVLVSLGNHDMLRWSKLVTLPREGRAALFHLRLQQLLLDERWEEAAEELRDPSFIEELSEDPALREVLWLPLIVAAWERSEEELTVFHESMALAAETRGAEIFQQVMDVRDDLKKLCRFRRRPPSFVRLFRLGRLGRLARLRLFADLETSLVEEDAAWAEITGLLTREYDLLFAYLKELLRAELLAVEKPPDSVGSERREQVTHVLEDSKHVPRSLWAAVSGALTLLILAGAVIASIISVLDVADTGDFAALGERLLYGLGILGACMFFAVLESNATRQRRLVFVRQNAVRAGVGYRELLATDAALPDGLFRGAKEDPALELHLAIGLAARRASALVGASHREASPR